ncbi:cbb3-type cytochrome oxidase assembly protein CcoS [Anaerobacillus sp. MEB173]|uniref:cbb3-type cytochrome oxidase assembly protein CcoS n=1 Tax=Anaerobacillus sp. MEB173 TaxID=3383345 RepID=UPI003F8DBBC7
MLLATTVFGMTVGAWTLIMVIFSFMGTALLIYLWAKKDGQFDDVEGIKYRMLHEEFNNNWDVKHDD